MRVAIHDPSRHTLLTSQMKNGDQRYQSSVRVIVVLNRRLPFRFIIALVLTDNVTLTVDRLQDFLHKLVFSSVGKTIHMVHLAFTP